MLQPVRASVPTVFGRPGGPRRHALALAAAGLLAAPASQALQVFTGNAPVYVGAWFNGVTTEVQEFQFALDWAGWCNARAGATCRATRYWSSAGNWDNGAVPTAASDVRVEIGQTVRIGSFNSLYQGPLSGVANAGQLSAAGRVELYGLLSVGNATIADLHNDRDNNGTLQTSGLATIGLLSSGAGIFQGAGGTTRVQAFAPSSVRAQFEPLVREGHTLDFVGNSLGIGLAVRLAPGARFVNSGVLDMAGGTVGLQGTATFAELPVFNNQGTLLGGGSTSGLVFNNAGRVELAAGEQLALGNAGRHGGTFMGGPGSVLSFAGIASAGHVLLSGSQVNSAGAVNFGVGRHQVSGGFNAGTVDMGAGGTLVFDGVRPVIGTLQLRGGSTLDLLTSGGADIGTLAIDGGFSRFTADAGGALALQRLALSSGSLVMRSPGSVAQQLTWASGVLAGDSLLSVAGGWQLLAGDRRLLARVENSGNVAWQGGQFTEWSGRFVHAAGAQFNILGDFSSAGGLNGRFVNIGQVAKRAGSGRSTLAMGFDNLGGTVQADTGTLALSGGGTHTDASFSAAAGAAIELAGGTVFGQNVTTAGLLHLTGGDFSLLNNSLYQHGAGGRFEVAGLRINPGAVLRVAEDVRATGSTTNLGSFLPAGNVSIGGDFDQRGAFTLTPGKNLLVDGLFTSHADFSLSDAVLRAGTLVNHARIDVVGNAFFWPAELDNRGTLVLGPGAVRADIVGAVNSGTLRVDGATVSVASDSLHNTGTVWNEGSWQSNLSFSQAAGAVFLNQGNLGLYGSSTLAGGSLLDNSGLVTQYGELTIAAGADLLGSGRFVQQDGLTRLNGFLQAGGGVAIDGGTLMGNGTVDGNLVIGPAAQWWPGTSPGTMAVRGDVLLQGLLQVELASATVHDRVQVAGQFATSADAVVDFVFGPAFTPQDGERITWLTAGSTQLDPGTRWRSFGMPTHWTAAPMAGGTGAALELTYDLALPIPVRGSHSVPLGELHANALTSDTGNHPVLDRLDNAGTVSNRSGASLHANQFNNLAGAEVINRGQVSAGSLDNAGLVVSHAGSDLSVNELNNRGRLLLRGSAWAGRLVNAPGGVVEQQGELVVAGMLQNEGRLLVAGRVTGPPSVLNQGELVVQAGGVIEGSGSSWFWSTGDASLVLDGLVSASDVRIWGALNGNGTLRGDTVALSGTVGPGHSVGQLTVDGQLTLDGTLDLEIESAISFDRVVVNGNAILNGALQLRLVGDYRPQLGDSFALLAVSGTVAGAPQWNILRQVDPLDASQGWTLWADAAGIYDPAVPADRRISFNPSGSFSVTAVPEPQTWALWAAGLAGLGWLGRRRRAAARRF